MYKIARGQTGPVDLTDEHSVRMNSTFYVQYVRKATTYGHHAAEAPRGNRIALIDTARTV